MRERHLGYLGAVAPLTKNKHNKEASIDASSVKFRLINATTGNNTRDGRVLDNACQLLCRKLECLTERVATRLATRSRY